MEHTPDVRTIETAVHGRYLVRVPQAQGPAPALVTFHGYAEDAATNLAAAARIPDTDDWLIVSVQALHPFYTKNQRVVASWMTRQDRELAIADNVAYVQAVIDAVVREFPQTPALVFAGFSQGAAMAYRAAAHITAVGVIALAGDVPPDIPARPDDALTGPLPHVLVGRGRTDTWYTEERMTADVARLQGLAASVETCVFDGGHEWTDMFAAAAGAFLMRLRKAPSFAVLPPLRPRAKP